MAEYAVQFRVIAANSGWHDVVLWGVLCQGLNESLKDELAERDKPLVLQSFIDLAICQDNRL